MSSRGLRARARAGVASLVVAGLGAMLTGGCRSDRAPEPARTLPPTAPTVVVTMSEFRLVFANRVPAGRVVFKVVNGGRLSHRLSLVALADDSPPVATLATSANAFVDAPLVQMPVLGPNGATGSFAVDLEPGARYAMVSTWPGPQGQPDFELGMAAEFRAAPGRAGA